jgi:hypothetical protein
MIQNLNQEIKNNSGPINAIILCPLCNTKLNDYLLNLNEIILTCGNKYVKNFFYFLTNLNFL